MLLAIDPVERMPEGDSLHAMGMRKREARLREMPVRRLYASHEGTLKEEAFRIGVTNRRLCHLRFASHTSSESEPDTRGDARVVIILIANIIYVTPTEIYIFHLPSFSHSPISFSTRATTAPMLVSLPNASTNWPSGSMK